MAFYALTDRQILEMPVGRFWMLERNIGRIQAENDLRSVNVVSAPHVKSPQEIQSRLTEELGTVIVLNHKRDDDANKRLLALGGAGR